MCNELQTLMDKLDPWRRKIRLIPNLPQSLPPGLVAVNQLPKLLWVQDLLTIHLLGTDVPTARLTAASVLSVSFLFFSLSFLSKCFGLSSRFPCQTSSWGRQLGEGIGDCLNQHAASVRSGSSSGFCFHFHFHFHFLSCVFTMSHSTSVCMDHQPLCTFLSVSLLKCNLLFPCQVLCAPSDQLRNIVIAHAFQKHNLFARSAHLAESQTLAVSQSTKVQARYMPIYSYKTWYISLKLEYPYTYSTAVSWEDKSRAN